MRGLDTLLLKEFELKEYSRGKAAPEFTDEREGWRPVVSKFIKAFSMKITTRGNREGFVADLKRLRTVS